MSENEGRPSVRVEVYSVRDLSTLFRVTSRTVRRWVHDGLLKPKGYKLRGGNSIELVFTQAEVEKFLDWYLINPRDLDLTSKPKGPKERAAQLRRIIGTLRMFAGKATASKAAKQLAVDRG